MTRSGRRISRIAIAAALASAPLFGCYQEPAPPPPAPAPAPRALTVTAQRKQSQAQQDRDSGQCQSQASAQATSSQEWTVIFTSCMSGRGYRVE